MQMHELSNTDGSSLVVGEESSSPASHTPVVSSCHNQNGLLSVRGAR